MGAERVRKTGDADVGGVASFVAAAVSAAVAKGGAAVSFSFSFFFLPEASDAIGVAPRGAPPPPPRGGFSPRRRAFASPSGIRAASAGARRALLANLRGGGARDSVRGAQFVAQRHGRGEVLGRRALEPRVDVLVVRRRVRRLEVEVVRRAKLPPAADTTAVRG